MAPCDTKQRRCTTRGFTLMELLLVLALIVMLYALAMPGLKGPLASHRLRSAADVVRHECAKTRVDAMQTGQVHILEFLPDTDQYRVTPWVSPDDLLESSYSSYANNGSAAGSQTGLTPKSRQSNLPEGITFIWSETDDSRSLAMSTGPSEQNDLDTEWSSPIFFYPDGTTSTVRLVLANERSSRIQVKLRGLTGVATIGSMASAEELMQ